jgi:ATP-dependent DNA helicase RecG
MVTSAERRQAALAAIAAVVAGQSARDAETELVDFKLEEDRWDHRVDAPREIGPRNERAALALARDAACMANNPRKGGILVVGVHDRKAGPAAFIGACSDADWLRQRIHALTQPALVTDVEEVTDDGARLLLINVPDALAETYVDRTLRRRLGTDCVELTGDAARRFLEERRGFDWSAQPSGFRLSDATPEAVESGSAHYVRRHGSGAIEARELAVRLKALVDPSEDNPELNNAGALLLCPFEPERDQIDLLVTRAEGAASTRRVHGPAPVLPLYDRVLLALLQDLFPGHNEIIGGENQVVRALPELVLREALVNAIMHRDYRLDRATTVVLVAGDPIDTYKVRSPGGFLPEVSPDQLLRTQSAPRNRVLAEAMHVLGLAEREGVGIDNMYRAMLRDGHDEPEITEEGGEVVVRLSVDEPDLRVREYFDRVAKRRKSIAENVRASIAMELLCRRAILRPELLAAESQASPADAQRALTILEEAGAVERLLNGSRSWRLTIEARAALSHRLRYRRRTTAEERLDQVEALFDVLPEVGSADVVGRLGISRVLASRALGALVAAGRIEGTTRIRRGPNMRYRRVG